MNDLGTIYNSTRIQNGSHLSDDPSKQEKSKEWWLDGSGDKALVKQELDESDVWSSSLALDPSTSIDLSNSSLHDIKNASFKEAVFPFAVELPFDKTSKLWVCKIFHFSQI